MERFGRQGDDRNVAVTLGDAAKRTTVTGVREPEADPQTIRPDAQVLFVAGAGWTKKQADGKTHIRRSGRNRF